MKNYTKFTEIYEGHIIAEKKVWTCEVEDKEVPLAIYIEILDMKEATGEPEFKQYPFVVSFGIMAAKPHKSFYEGEGKVERLSLLSDCHSYMGSVPIDHLLLETDKLNKNITLELKAKDAQLTTHKAEFGTLAAQQGKGAEITYPQFKTYEAAEKWAKTMVEKYADVHMMCVGFVLDRPINMMGEPGWNTITKQVEGK